MLTGKMRLAAALTLAALLAAEAAYAQKKYRAPPKRYDAPQPWSGGSRFTPEEQRIIDQITANDWRNR